jgi:hypothetical protein
MTSCTKGDQILLNVIAELSSRLDMVNLKTFHPSARLAAPTISFQHFSAKLAIGFRL